jgi:hypothetical protein
MITANSTLAVHAGEERSALAAVPRQYWFTNHPEYDGKSVAELVVANERANFAMRAGDVVYVAEIRRHVLTDDDLNAAAHAVIRGVA